MRYLIIGLVVALVVLAATACAEDRYFHHAGPDEPTYIVTYLPSGAVDAECRRRGARSSKQIWACAQIREDPCRMVLPSDVDYWTQVRLTEHEKAHCRGWRHG